MLDVSISYNRYRFLGHEFLTWLWFLIETDPESIRVVDEEVVSLSVGNRIVIENLRDDDAVETVTIKGDDAGLEEALVSLKKGAVVTEMNLIFRVGDNEWRFTLKGESLNISSLKTPETAPVKAPEDIEGALLEKAFLCERVVTLVRRLFDRFIRIRISNEWSEKTVGDIRSWIAGGASGA
jgi:hypothetical protein